ncbi:MAG: DUF1232 domain-containing protein [Actinobacteria bacterium]|uniref:Unannotated protein n=1 Tax=freshwater metagenome TaxID=449393 RepID=A0A6J5YF30_9ZZZZ|nr:DUF1232 domain-containing protein [Actinomycetota bacterium]
MEHGPGWWLASDGKWYPPESHPNYTIPDPPPPPNSRHTPVSSDLGVITSNGSDLETRSRRFRSGISLKHVALIAACITYVVSPIDVLPEALLGPFGLPDDVVVLLTGIGVFLAGRRTKRPGY